MALARSDEDAVFLEDDPIAGIFPLYVPVPLPDDGCTDHIRVRRIFLLSIRGENGKDTECEKEDRFHMRNKPPAVSSIGF